MTRFFFPQTCSCGHIERNFLDSAGKKYCYHSGKIWIRNQKYWKEKYWTSFKIKKNRLHNFSRQENSNFDFLLINCGHNSHLSALKNPRTTKMKLYFFKITLLPEKLFGGNKNAALARLPRKVWRDFEKKIGSNSKKDERKKWTSFKIKKNTSHFYSGKYQSRFDNLLKKVGQKSVLSSLKKAKTHKIPQN